MPTDKIQLFNQQKIRSHWDAEQEKWYFSIVDVVGILTDSPNPRNYWKVLKHLKKENLRDHMTNFVRRTPSESLC